MMTKGIFRPERRPSVLSEAAVEGQFDIPVRSVVQLLNEPGGSVQKISPAALFGQQFIH
jgi:hypothetical protein